MTENNFYLTNNTNFTLKKSNIPFTILPQDSFHVEIFYAPTSSRTTIKNSTKIDHDTLLITTDCYDFTIFLKGTPTPNYITLTGRCNIPIRMVGDSINVNSYVPQITPNPITSNIFSYSFSVIDDDNVTIEIYDINGKIIKEISSCFLETGLYEIEILIDDLAKGVYFVGLRSRDDNHFSKFIIN